MRKLLPALFILIAINFQAKAQIAVAYHQSSLPFIGINYQIGERFIPEARIGVNYFFEDVSLELSLPYVLATNENYQFYAGIGGRIQGNETSLVIPVGINIFPFEHKQFGFHIELAPLINTPSILRGSWGIRYRFLQD
ncbi:MAG: hypothetical protein ACI9XJ_002532 [Marivirga sp.]|jgi:hypothetical protein